MHWPVPSIGGLVWLAGGGAGAAAGPGVGALPAAGLGPVRALAAVPAGQGAATHSVNIQYTHYTATISGQRRHSRQYQNPSAPSPGPEFHKRFVLVRVHVQLSIITTCIKQLVVLKHFLEAGGGREGPIKTRI